MVTPSTKTLHQQTTHTASKVGILIILAFITVYILPLNHRPLIIPDESRYAEIPREMIAGDHWFRLRQAGLPYYEKSPLGYWMNALSISALGKSNLAVRLPSALSSGLTALAIFLLVRKKRKEWQQAALAAVVYLSCVEVFGVGTFAVLDSMFSLFVCVSMVLYLIASEHTGRAKAFFLALSGAACGGAFLTKGFTALVIPAITLLGWHIWQKTYRALFRDWMIPVIAAAVVVAPFAYQLHIHNPDFWRYFFWTEHIQRFIDPLSGQHKTPAWFFLPVFVVGAMPWSFFLPPILVQTYRHARTDAMTRFCICWFVLPFIFFSLCGGKLITYILPCFAPFAILASNAICEYRQRSHLRICAITGAAILAAAVLVFFVWLPFSKEDHLRRSVMEDSQSIALTASVVLTLSGLLLAARRLRTQTDNRNSYFIVALSFSIMFVASFLFLPRGIEDRKSPSRLLRAVLPQSPGNAFVITDERSLSSACWYYQRDDIIFFGGKGELKYGLAHANAEERFADSFTKAGKMLQQKLEMGQPVAVLAERNNFRNLTKKIPSLTPHLKRELSVFVWALYLPEEGAGYLQANAAEPHATALQSPIAGDSND